MAIEFHPEDFFSKVTTDAGQASLRALADALNGAAASGSQFLVDQALLSAKYLSARNNGEISGAELAELVADMDAALQAEMLKMSMAARVAAQRLCQSLMSVLRGALSVLVTVV